MAKNGIPQKLVAYNVYNSGKKLVGVDAEVELPDFEALTTTVSGAGILGEIDSPNIGYFGSLVLAIAFRTLDEESVELFEPRKQSITLRADEDSYDVVKGEINHRALKVIVSGLPKSLKGGKFKAGDPTGSQTGIEIHYIKIELDGKTLVELDKFNYIFVVNDKDWLAAVRNNI